MNLVTLRDVSVAYDGYEALRHVDLEIADHDFLGVIGPNGGGKTTLLYEMAGFCVKNDQKVLVTTSTHIYRPPKEWHDQSLDCLLYTSDAADE